MYVCIVYFIIPVQLICISLLYKYNFILQSKKKKERKLHTCSLRLGEINQKTILYVHKRLHKWKERKITDKWSISLPKMVY